MLDWNGNGKIDPVDIGISIALDENEEQVSEIDIEHNKAHANCSKSKSDYRKYLKGKK